MDMETPREKKPRILKRIKKKKLDLNVSSSTKKKKAFSYGRSNISLSTSIQKQSLRANNKALAFNLERSREALRSANETNLELQKTNQELHMKITTLERVAGLKNEDIESEVKIRLKKHMSELKTKMVCMRRLFYDGFACMDEVMDMCNMLSRQSNASSCSSVSDTSMSQGTSDGHCRSLFPQIPKTGFSSMLSSQLPSQDNITLMSGQTSLSSISCDMSMIAETSVLLDDIPPPSGLMESITDIPEAGIENVEPQKPKSHSDNCSENCVKMAPQRVLKKKKKSKGSPPIDKSKLESAVVEQDSAQTGSPAVRNRKLDRRGTFVVNTSDDLLPREMFSTKNDSEMDNEETKLATKVPQVSKDPADEEAATGSDSSSKTNPPPQPPKSESPVNGTKEISRSPVITSRTRSRSKGRLNKPVLTVTEGEDISNVQDRRKTFVVPTVGHLKETCKPSTSKSSECLSVEGGAETTDDRRKTFLLPPTLSKVVNNQSFSPVLPENCDDVTQCFSQDMEMTEMIDSTQLIQVAVPELNHSKEIKATENNQKESEKEIPKPSKQGNENITLLPNSSDTETLSKPAPVEFRLPRPGKIIFSASRKELDGSRKPVPSKLPLKSQSKSKIKLSRSKGQNDVVPESPKELKSIFDFHDRTPKPKEDATTKKTGSVFDLSMNESLRDNVNKPSLSQFRETCGKAQKDETTTGSKPTDIKLLPDNPVYYAPLKECSPDPPVRNRSRSKSRTRKENAEKETESHSSRARSRSRRRDAEEKPEDETVVNILESRGRSRSKRRQDTEEGASPDQAILKDSVGIENEAENRRSRGRSRSRRRKDTEESEIEVTDRSQSRNRKKDVDDESEKGGSYSRTRSRSRRRKEQVVQDVILANDNSDSDCDGTDSRSRSTKKKRHTDDDPDFIIQKGGTSSRKQSRSKHRKLITDNDIPTEDADSKSNNGDPGITMERKQIQDADLNTLESELEEENDGQTLTAMSSDKEKENIVTRKSRGRSKSRGRVNVNQDVDIETRKSRGRSKSRGRVNVNQEDVDVVTRKSRGRSKSRGRVNVNQEDVDIETKKSRGRSKSRQRKDTVETETDILSLETRSTTIEETPDKELNKIIAGDADYIEDYGNKDTFKRSRSRARSRTMKREEWTGDEGIESKQETQSKTKTSEEQPEVVKPLRDEDQIVKNQPEKCQSPKSDVEVVPASSDEDTIIMVAEEYIEDGNLLQSSTEKNKGDCIDNEESIMIISSPSPPTKKVKAKKKLSLHKKSSRNSFDPSDANEQENKARTEEDAKCLEERNILSEKKRKVAPSDGDEIPRLAEGLFVTKRGRSLKLSRQTRDNLDDQDFLFDLENIPNENHVETQKMKLCKTPKTPSAEGPKTTQKEKTTSSKLKKLKSAKKSTKKRRRSSCNSLSEAEQQTPISSTNKENPSLGILEQLQNIKKKLNKTSIGSQVSTGLGNFDFSKLDMGNSEPEYKRPKRGDGQVSYKELSLNAKLRREDMEAKKTIRKPLSNVSTPVAKKT